LLTICPLITKNLANKLLIINKNHYHLPILGVLKLIDSMLIRKLTILTLFVCTALSASTAQELDKLMLQWTQLEQQYSEIDNNWRQKRPLMQQRMALLHQEIQQQELQLKQHNSGTGEVEKQRNDLLAKQVRLEQEQLQVDGFVQDIQLLLKDISSRLPPHMQQQWQKELQQIQELENNSEKLEKQLSLSAQLQSMAERILLNVTTMMLPDNTQVQVSQFFLGASHGWYVSNDGQYWGSGRSQLSGWHWLHQDPQLQTKVLLDIVAMLNSEKTPSLLDLPVTLRGQ